MLYYNFVDLATRGKLNSISCSIKDLLENVIRTYRYGNEYVGLEIYEYDNQDRRIASITFNKYDKATVSIFGKKSILLGNMDKILEAGCESGIKVIDRFAGRIVGGWSDLELVNGVIRHNSSSKAYFDFNKSVYYFVEYDKDGERIRGITDKKSIVSALFDDMTVTVDSISVMTDDKSIYVHIMHDLTGNRLYGCFSYANTFDMTWIKWFRRICYGECRG